MITATRYHDISCGHRVFGHESKCAHLHGHNYRFYLTIRGNGPGGLDPLGRVLDFSVIKTTLCAWLEENWDHKFLIFEGDRSWASTLVQLDPLGVVICSFNPTAENIAKFFLMEIAPGLLLGRGCSLIKCTVEETRKCSATYEV